MPTLEFVALLRKVSGGDHVSDPRVRYLRASTVKLDFERPALVNTDGEVLEEPRATTRCRRVPPVSLPATWDEGLLIP